ncbi:MAG: hypothetical protein ACI8TQ_002092 [Planctomycetota bacterium]
MLHLTSGSILRGSSRLEGDEWKVLVAQNWTTIPVSMVERAVEERALLSEAKRHASKVKRNDHAARILHARWLKDQGLYSECLTSIDRVLKAEPDFPAALKLVAERPVKLRLPSMESDLGAFMQVAARTSPSTREYAINELKSFQDRSVLSAQLQQELVSSRDERRDFATLALRRLMPGEGIDELLRRVVLDRSPQVRAGAALALRDAKNPEVVEPVIKALNSKHALLRQNAATALGSMNYALAAQPLITALASASGSSQRAPRSHIFVGTQTAYVQDYDVEVAQSEAIANPRINTLSEGSVLDVRVSNISSVSVTTQRRTIRDALTKLTGAKVGSSTKAWEKWWDKSGAEWTNAHPQVQ